MRYLILWILSLLIVSVLGPPGTAQEVSFRAILSRFAPQDPQTALTSLKVRPGFRAELVCSEPLVSDPIAIDWGPDGRLWVVEMGDYPQGGDTAAVAQGRIRFLEDTDHDGKYDRSTIFLDGLHFPTGVMVWRRGVLITCAPDILYAEDTDGDGRADRQQLLYDGFVVANPQHQVNCLRWGLDNWIYGANGDNGGTITSVKTGIQVDIHGRDFRIRPDTGQLQTQTGMAQYGRCRDDWGNWFGGRNLQPSWHCALDDQYLLRNPYLAPPNPCIDLMDPPTCAPVYPVSTPLPRFNEFWTLNRFTASCGISVYRDELFGPAFANSYFVCEPAYNLVHRSVMYPRGTTFFSRRAADEQQSEFLASTDHWFRPVQTRTGPDGALWVVDMYRLVIEHPDYIPEKWHAELDFPAGRGMGRIYRILPVGVAARPWGPLSHMNTVELAREIDHPNGPRRDTIQQLLIHQQDRAAIEPLLSVVRQSQHPQARLSALCTLDGLGAVDISILQVALADPHPAVRRHAIRLAEKQINDDPQVATLLLRLLDDEDAQVRMQLAYTLGQWSDPRAGQALASIAIRDADDPLMMAAVMSSATRYPEEMLRRLLSGQAPSEAQVALIENLMRLVLEAEESDTLAFGVRQVATPRDGKYQTWQYTLLAGLADALEYRGQSLRDLQKESTPALRQALEATAGLQHQARQDALDPSVAAERRVQAMRLIGRGLESTDEDLMRLSDMLVPQTPLSVQRGVVDAMERIAPDNLADILLQGWSQLGPDIRPRVIDILLNQEQWALRLLEYVEAGDVSANELGATNRSRLILHTSAQVRTLAARLFQPSTPAQRLATIERFRGMLKLPADANRGRLVFRKHCTTCHRLEDEGTDIGPDLLALTDRSAETLLVSILDPDRAVEPRYVEYSAVTERGRVYAGIVAAETGGSITLIDSQGVKHSLPRSDVVELVSTGKSLMPVGVEELLDKPQDLLDLITYVRSVEPDPAGRRPRSDSLQDVQRRAASSSESPAP